MNAKVWIQFEVKNVCNPEDYGKKCQFKTFADLVKNLIKEEGIFGVAEDEYKIILVKHDERD